MNKEERIMKFIFQKIEEGYNVIKIDTDLYEFRIINKKYNYADFITLDILPYVQYVDEINQGSNYKNGFNILN
jgi:hypothetical protein